MTEPTSPALNEPVMSAERRALDIAAQTIRLLLKDAEDTAENSFHPSFMEFDDGRREEIPWRDGWRLGDPEWFELCQRARKTLADIRALVPDAGGDGV